MFILTKVLQPLLLFLVIQCIHGKSQQPAQPLLQLNNIVTGRINSMLEQHQNFNKQSANEEFLQHYERLTLAATLPIDQLDEKIRAFSSFRDYDDNLGKNNVKTSDGDKSEFSRQVTLPPNSEEFNAFEMRVINLLQRIGVYDPFTDRVFKAIFSNEKLLRMLKQKLKELDDNDKKNDKYHDCCLWDLIFGLF